MNLKDLYQEIILDHGKNPRNLRRTDNFNKDAKGHNPLCGDKVHVFLKLNENKKIEDIFTKISQKNLSNSFNIRIIRLK